MADSQDRLTAMTKLTESCKMTITEEQVQLGAAAEAAGRPALIERFEIEELYGYRTLTLSSTYAATVLIAKNGSGKTTLLAALNAFLRREFHRLTDIQFSKITCKLRGLNEILELDKEALTPLSQVDPNSELSAFAQRFGIDPVDFSDYLLGDYEKVRNQIVIEPSSSDIFYTVYQKMSYNRMEARKICDRLLASRRKDLPFLSNLSDKISIALNNVEIVYLPTYRRIELSISNKESRPRDPSRKEASIQSKLGLPRRALFSSDIYFGLGDITSRLAELNNKVQSASNIGYREISANIISELVDGTFEREDLRESQRPDKESLNVFFSRLRDKENRRYSHYDDVIIPDIDKIYNDGGSSEEVNKFLQYFLGKLNKVVDATRDTEKMVEEFVSNCNSYLQEDDGQLLENSLHGPSSIPDSKYLHLDKRTLQVRVRSLIRNRDVSVDALSSGEKQMISLFARLYLYEGEKIVLIDEPELSLSLEWQRRILKDILVAPSCSQLIAITHSPFVFDNELEPYAKSIEIAFKSSPESNDEEYNDE
ncbi:AAA family ATPase [Burkholderia sp. LMU1-1-1.1]|uniref:AAA family ATPase n=1 Tax=Burkholderia sp. LMU1-1-1.1 TaxID=3135266 RepID=UPI003419CACD